MSAVAAFVLGLLGAVNLGFEDWGEGRAIGLVSRRVGATIWRRLEVEGHVAPGAERSVIATRLEGAGAAWFDDLAIAVR